MDRDEILTKASNGNSDALAFLRAFARRAHWVDDLADRDNVPGVWGDRDVAWYQPERFAEEEAHWLTTLATNPFFLTHRAQLVPCMVLALSAWVDSHGRPPGQESVLKAGWHEVVWLVAWLTGGWAAMRKACMDREFDVEIMISMIPERKESNGLPG